MLKKLLPLMLLIALVGSACNSAAESTGTDGEENPAEKADAASSFSLTIDGESQEFNPSSSWATHWEKTFSIDGI